MNQSPHLTKDRFAWIILNYVILSVLDVKKYFDYNMGKVKISLSKIISSGSISIKSQGRQCQVFGLCVWAEKNSSFNTFKVFKTNVTCSQRSGKDNTKIEYC